MQINPKLPANLYDLEILLNESGEIILAQNIESYGRDEYYIEVLVDKLEFHNVLKTLPDGWVVNIQSIEIYAKNGRSEICFSVHNSRYSFNSSQRDTVAIHT